jgi:hypothetical protein
MLRIWLARVFERRPGRRGRAPPAPRKAELDVNGEGDSEIDDRGPESIVASRGISVAGWKGIDGNGFEAQISAMVQLVYRVIDIGDGNDANTDQPVRSVRAVFLGEPIVVSADNRVVRVVVSNTAPEARANIAREQYLCINAVPVLFQ